MLSSKMLKVLLVAGAAVACGGPAGEPDSASPAAPPGAAAPVAVAVTPAALQRVTPILAVEAIEPVLPFWEALGFSRLNPSWEGDRLVFVGLAKDGLEIHYQTKAHIEGNIPAAADMLAGTTSLVYLTVDSLEPVVAALGDAEVVIPRRRTSWGSDEIYVKEPGGNIIAFAAFGR